MLDGIFIKLTVLWDPIKFEVSLVKMNFLGTFLNALKPRVDDDIVDRLNYYYTCFILLILSITISAKQYVGQPVQCWVPAQFTGAWEQYAENYCFVQNTYWLPLNDPVPSDHSERVVRQIGYYQWVPFVLAIQALLFYLPCVIWRLFSWQSGINVQSVVTMATDSHNISFDARHRSVKTIARHIEDCLELQRKLRQHSSFNEFKYRPIFQLSDYWHRIVSGTYVTLLYLLVKLLYMTNVTGQFYMLSSFLAPKYRFWGAEILIDLANGREWHESGHFPRVTMCHFEVRVLGNLHGYTIQCVLMINMFNEKVFLFLWWWFLFVSIANSLNFLYWLLISLCHCRRRAFVQRYLNASQSLDPFHSPIPSIADNRFLTKFLSTFLRLDGIFILRMISLHAGDLISTEIVGAMWTSYYTRYIALPYAVEQTDHPDQLASYPPKALYHNLTPKRQMYTFIPYGQSTPADHVIVGQSDGDGTNYAPDESGFIEMHQRNDITQAYGNVN